MSTWKWLFVCLCVCALLGELHRALALGREILAAGLFVAVGSRPSAGSLKADRVLLVSGRFEELINGPAGGAALLQ